MDLAGLDFNKSLPLCTEHGNSSIIKPRNWFNEHTERAYFQVVTAIPSPGAVSIMASAVGRDTVFLRGGRVS